MKSHINPPLSTPPNPTNLPLSLFPLPTMSSIIFIFYLLFSSTVTLSLAETHTECGVAQTAFSFCVSYVAGLDRTLSPKCCMGIRAVQEMVPDSLGQRGMCECLKQELAAAGAVDGARAASLTRKCGVTTNFLPTNLDYDCNGIS